MRIHPVFYVSLIEKAPQNAKTTNVEVEDEQEEYEVEQVLGHREISGTAYYLVKWKGYSTSENTWEPIENLQNAQRTMVNFHRSHPGTS